MNVKLAQQPNLEAGHFCYVIPVDGLVAGYGFRVSIAVEGEKGHYPTGDWPCDYSKGQRMPWFWGQDYAMACELADDANRRLGLKPEDVIRIVGSTLGGKRKRKK